MRLEWSQDFSVGVEEIDLQHKELFSMINNLDSAMRQGKARDEIANSIEFLDRYAVVHFATEEKYMTDCDYPGYSLHKSRHNWFAREMSEIRKVFETEGPTPGVIVRSNNLLIIWFSNHVRTFDIELGIFLKAKMKVE